MAQPAHGADPEIARALVERQGEDCAMRETVGGA